MARGRLSHEEVVILQENPYVEFVSRQRIMYTYEFKCLFMEQYLAGKRPVDIFRQAGFDVSVLGEKRIERATARWKSLYAGNGVEGLKSSARQLGNSVLSSAGKNVKKENAAINSLTSMPATVGDLTELAERIEAQKAQ